MLNSDGSKLGGEFIVNSTTGGERYSPSIAVLNDGRFVVAWTDGSGAGGELGKGIRARVYKMDGTPVDYDFRVNTHPGHATDTAQRNQFAPSVAALANGGFVISYTDDFQGDGGSGRGIRSQTYNASLEKIRDEVYVNGATTGDQQLSISLGLQDGRQVVIYEDRSSGSDDPAGYTVRGRILDREGRPIPGTTDFVVPSSRDWKINPSATVLKDGRFVVIWQHIGDRTGDGSDYAVKGQIFNPDGTVYGGEFLVNTTTSSRQWLPAVAATADGGFAVTYADGSNAVGNTHQMRMMTFDAYGTRVGLDTVIGTVTFPINKSSLTALADGRLMVAWEGEASGGSLEVWGQIVDPRGQGVVLNGSALDDQYVGTRWNDVLHGASGNDRLTGEAGDDVLDGGTGNDTMNGGAGNDTFHVDSSGDSIADASGIDTVVTTFSRGLESFLENLTASGSGALTLTGNGLNNTITGNDAANVIDGGTGADTMQGGAGSDTYYVHDAGDRIVEAANGGTDQVYTTASHTLDASVEHLTASGSSSINLTGNTLANVIKGNNGHNKISGGAGNDQLWGGRGKDTFVFDTGLNSRTNKDLINDWNYREDTIQLENKVFKKLTKTGTLKKEYFVIGSAAKDGNDFIGYNKANGDLWYDTNGNAQGGQVVFANIGKNKALFHTDFVVI